MIRPTRLSVDEPTEHNTTAQVVYNGVNGGIRWIEVDTVAGYGIRLVSDENGRITVDKDGNFITERIEGDFKLVWPEDDTAQA